MTLDSTWARRFVERAADTVSENRAALIELDREIGDGDHGENLERGFSAVRAKLASQPDDATPGALLKMVATTLISTVGGASGPLLGTAFLKGAGAIGDATEIDSAAVAAFVAAARDGAVLRGKAEVGDKTMIDAWTPASDAAKAAADAGGDPTSVLRAAADAAADGAASTEPLVARKGRASYLGERAVGHRDPGAQSSALILAAAADAADDVAAAAATTSGEA
ncbi:dihydroxyacetone kinase subunit L [Frigoribacterium sp. ACAM 257]|uniref:dihydroxyacetone kinase subunit DhaL n=1 Tax=Frigoribacterium sp. ACAM 257 TaxID=2508998 RepID=UPI0011B953A3|nr:dihydroxyacetone kinase subunit DhaL [Frigoribacterium sp. ACAM 257]TWX40833.1 dihydroxyacetone kinase subunit L [Frigoribacterium sp. ACAM 257]